MLVSTESGSSKAQHANAGVTRIHLPPKGRISTSSYNRGGARWRAKEI